jgi:hypothetical protein
LNYTIIHPGGLVDTKEEGSEQFVLDVNDNMLKNKKLRAGISRVEVANLCVAALTVGKHQSVSFDCITTLPTTVVEGETEPKPILSAEQALEAFLQKGITADYSL